MDSRYQKAVVTGATGFLGSYLSYFLAKDGYEVTMLRRKTSKLQWHDKIIEFLEEKHGKLVNPSFRWVEADITDPASLIPAMEGKDIVYHCAAIVSFDPSQKNDMVEVNTKGTANVVNACLQTGIKKIVHVSSTAAIGRVDPDVLINEDKEWEDSKHNTFYGITKYQAELEVWRGAEEGLDMVIANPCIILGMGNWNDGAASIVKRIHNGFKFYPPGTNAFVDVEDVATMMIKLAESDLKSQRFLLISENVKFKLLFNQIAEAFGVSKPSIRIRLWMANLAWRSLKLVSLFSKKKVFINKETAIATQHNYLYDNSKVRKALNVDFIPVNETIKSTTREFIKQKANR